MARRNKKRKSLNNYPNGGDGMFFFHKKTGHPAEQLSHTEKTWTNRRYTHSPNNMSNYVLDKSKSSNGINVFYHKSIFTDSIYTRGKPYSMNQYKNKKR